MFNRRKFIKGSAASALWLAAPSVNLRFGAWRIEDIHASYDQKHWASYLGPLARPEHLAPEFRIERARMIDRLRWSADAQILQFSGASKAASGQGTLSCGAYYPDATTTGVPSGTSLTPSGNVTTSSNGQVIQNLNISGVVRIRHNNVTLKNCLISSGDFFIVECDANSPTGFVFQDCEVDGLSSASWGFLPDGGGGGSITRRNNFYASENAIGTVENAMQVTDNYIHDLATGPTLHTDGIQGTGNYTSLNIDHNSVYGVDTSCVIQQNEFGGFSGLVINNNLLVMGSGSAAIYIRGDKSAGVVGNCSVTNNRLGKGSSYNSIQSITGTLTYTGNVDWQTCATVTSAQ